jgi:cobalamin biosynthesis protein CobT
MAAMDDEADDQQALLQMLREQMGSEATPETLAQVEQIRASLLAEKARLDEDVQAGRLSGEEFARRVNDLVSSYLPRLAEVIGLEGMREVIGAQPGESVQLLDPAMAAICNYRQTAKSEQR